jgi:hypothetical protein
VSKTDCALPSGHPNYGKLAAKPDTAAKILDMMAHGKGLTTIAREFGVSPQAIDQFIENHPDLKRHQRVGLQARMETREGELEQASEQVEVSRSRELLAHARWLAERLDERFSPKGQLHVSGTLSLDMLLEAAEPEPIDVPSEDISHPDASQHAQEISTNQAQQLLTDGENAQETGKVK